MNYRLRPIRQTGAQRVVLERTFSFHSVVPLTFRLLGSGCLLSGLLVLTGSGLRDLHPAALFALGCGLLAMAFAQLFVEHLHMPRRFVFDNDKKVLFVVDEQESNLARSAQLPYRDIQRFHTLRRSLPAGGGRKVEYTVEMLKQDGAFWGLYRSTHRERAEEFCAQLQKHVELHDARQDPPPPPPVLHSLGRLLVEESEERTSLSWKSRTLFRHGLALALFSLGLLLCLLPFEAFFSKVLLEIALWVFSSCALVGVSMLAYSRLSAHRIAITATQIRYTPPFSAEGGFTLDSEEIDTILFNFSLSRKEPTLYLLKPGEAITLLKHKRGQDGFLKSDTVSRILARYHSIDAGELSFCEQLHLEYALQDIIEKHCGHRIA